MYKIFIVQFGSKRGHDIKERNHLMAMLGSGPHTNNTGSGYYTVSDFRKILVRAAKLQIEIIPEFDMPGHSHAAIKSMERRYERLKREGAELSDALKYLLSDLSDQSSYMSGQFFKDSAINPCISSSYRFVERVVQAVITMYKVWRFIS